jgi:ADP-ribosylglycohydrolase
MRAAPVGLVHLGDPYRIYRDSLLQSVITHRDSMAIAAAACQADAVARAAIAHPGSLASLDSRVAFCSDLAALLDGLERPGYKIRGGRGAPSLHGRIGLELPQYLREGKVPFADWYNGAYVLESLPCALWCFLASPEDFEQTLFAAVDAGHDADTVAAMACSISGAYHGYSRLPRRLLDELEYRDHLVELADNLVGLHRSCFGAS